MMWFLLLGLAILVFLAAVVLAILAFRSLSARAGEEGAATDKEAVTPGKPARDIAFFVVAVVFLLQACCMLVAFIASRVQLGANPWG